jgi:hypothetical protein
MTTATREVVERYLADLAGHWLARDVQVIDLAGREMCGREQAGSLLAPLLRAAGPVAMIAADSHVALAWDGLAAVVEVTDGEIARISLYSRDAPTSATSAPAREDA